MLKPKKTSFIKKTYTRTVVDSVNLGVGCPRVSIAYNDIGCLVVLLAQSLVQNYMD